VTRAAARLLALTLLTLMAGGFGAPAEAHVRSESNSLWEINGAHVDLVMTLPVVEAQRLGDGRGPPSDQAVETYLTARVYPSADGARCKLLPPVVALSATPGYRKFDFTFLCASPRKLQITSQAFFDIVPSHVNFAQIQTVDGDFAEQLLTSEHRTVDVSAGSGSPLQTAGFLDFVGMGMMHIFTGVDHMSFILGFILISRRLRDLLFVVTGFTIGHSLTLALAVTGVLRPHAEYIDALVALTIALIGAENISDATGRPRTVAMGLGGLLLLMSLGKLLGFGGLPVLLTLGAGLFTVCYLLISGRLQDAARLRIVITLVFGLIHGFGFASNLLEMQLPTGRLAELLLGFNVGVEIAQVCLVLGVTLLVMGLGRLKLALPRPIVVEVAASFLVGLGLYWFVSRSYI
jgi:hypothetical protein